MARPLDKEYRAALLGALDQKLLVSMSEINAYLKQNNQFRSNHSSRRMLLKMVGEGLVFLHPQRLEKNELVFTKAVVSQQLTLKDLDGNIVDLSHFIANLYSEQFPEIVDSQAAIVIKHWMFDYLVGSDPMLFKGVREAPNRAQLKKHLQGTLQMLQNTHAFIKHFMDADIHSPVAESKIARELKECPPKQIEYLVTQKWLDDGNRPKTSRVDKKAS